MLVTLQVDYARDYFRTFVGNYARDFAGNYIGNYVGADGGGTVYGTNRAFGRTRIQNRISTYIGNYTQIRTSSYSGNFTRGTYFIGNYIGTGWPTSEVNRYVGNYSVGYTRIYAADAQNFQGNYAGDPSNTEYGGFYTGVESTATFTGDFQRTRVALGAFHRASNVGDGNYLRNSATGYTRTKASTIISVRERASTNIYYARDGDPKGGNPLYYIWCRFLYR